MSITRSTIRLAMFIVAVTVAAGAAVAQTAHILVPADNVQWGPAPPALPANYNIPAHGRSMTERADHPHAGQNLKDANWSPAPPLLPKGAEIAVLEGDPTKPGLYAVRLKFPEHYAIPAHSHPTDEHVVVTSGALVFGMGDVLDKRSKTNTKLTVGGFVDASANVNHFAFTRDEETTIVLYGEGPVEFNYVNPDDDPRNHPNASRQQ